MDLSALNITTIEPDSLSNTTLRELLAAIQAHSSRQPGAEPLFRINVEDHSEASRAAALFGRLASMATAEEQEALANVWSVESVIGRVRGPVWVPYVLLNGGILFRSYHRVLALQTCYGELEGTYAQFCAQIAKRKIKDPADAPLVLTHTEAGILTTNTLPDQVSEDGQTLISVSYAVTDKIASKTYPIIGASEVKAARKASCTGVVHFQFMGSKVRVYADTQLGLAYDQLLHVFATQIALPEAVTPVALAPDPDTVLTLCAAKLKEKLLTVVSRDTATLLQTREANRALDALVARSCQRIAAMLAEIPSVFTI